MDEWFADLVANACTEVLARADVQANLDLTDRVTADSIRADLTADSLAERFTDGVGRVQEIDRRRLEVLTQLLPGQWEAVLRAEDRVARARYPEAPRGDAGRAGKRGWGPWPGRRRPGTPPAPPQRKADYEAELVAAREAFSAASATAEVRDAPAVGKVDAERAEATSALQRQVTDAVALRVNEIIDSALTATYRREFSYAGSARLADQLDADGSQVSGEVNREASRAIQALIDSGVTGAVGIAGPRGIGKTTLLRRYARCEPPRSAFPEPAGDPALAGKRRWGVSVAAPAQYDARDFLLHLFGQLCTEVLGQGRIQAIEDEMTGPKARPRPRPGASLAWPAAYLGVMAALCGGVTIGLETARPVAPGRSMTDLLLAGCCASVALVIAAVPGRPLRFWLARTVEGYAVNRARTAPGSQWSYDRVRAATDQAERARWFAAAGCGALAALLAGLVAVGRPLDPGYLAAAALAVVTVALYAVVTGRFREITGRRNPGPGRRVSPDDRCRAEAEDWYRRVKFQQSYTTGWSGTVTVAPSALPVQVAAGRSGSTAVTPLAMSTPEIVTAFRSFTDVLSVAWWHVPSPGSPAQTPPAPGDPRMLVPGAARDPVVIGIDEVDKIEDPLTAQAFFNQVKGLFGDTSCLFLVSISDDAMAAYERRGLPLRDAFDSSLSTVITLSYLSRKEARTLIGSRLVRITEPAADLLYVLSGGLPRELVRLIRRAVDLQRNRAGGASAGEPDAARWLPPVPLDDLAVALADYQVAAQRRAVLIRGRALEPCAARDGLLAWAGDPASDVDAGDGASGAAGYFRAVLAAGTRLMAACDGNVADPQAGLGATRPHREGCAAQETGAYLFWLGTVGQVLGRCRDRDDFDAAERPGGQLSFERLARASQNFALGAGYVRAAVTAVRTAWDLDPPPASGSADGPLHPGSPRRAS